MRGREFSSALTSPSAFSLRGGERTWCLTYTPAPQTKWIARAYKREDRARGKVHVHVFERLLVFTQRAKKGPLFAREKEARGDETLLCKTALLFEDRRIYFSALPADVT